MKMAKDLSSDIFVGTILWLCILAIFLLFYTKLFHLYNPSETLRLIANASNTSEGIVVSWRILNLPNDYSTENIYVRIRLFLSEGEKQISSNILNKLSPTAVSIASYSQGSQIVAIQEAGWYHPRLELLRCSQVIDEGLLPPLFFPGNHDR